MTLYYPILDCTADSIDTLVNGIGCTINSAFDSIPHGVSAVYDCTGHIASDILDITPKAHGFYPRLLIYKPQSSALIQSPFCCY
jgi:hypothetical protein